MDSPVGCEAEHVEVFARGARHQLPCLDLLEPGDLVAKTSRLLIMLLARGFFHPRHERIDHVLVFAVQKIDGCLHISRVLLPGYQVDAGSRAAFNLVLEARARSIPEIAVAALANEEQFLQLVQRLANGTCTRVRAEITALALARTAVKLQARKLVFGRYVNVRVTLIIPQNDIEPGLVLLDQVVLEDQRLGFGIRDRDLDVRDQPHHCGSLCRVVRTVKIAGYALLQIPGFADVDHLVLRVQHAVNAGAMRQVAQQGFFVEFASLVHSATHPATRGPWQTPPRTSAWSGGRCSCCNGCSDRNPGAGMDPAHARRHAQTCNPPAGR